MQEFILNYLQEFPGHAILISILLNTFVAVMGVVPSFFVTGANLAFFGFWEGTLISMAGEVIGAIASFSLYRVGFKKMSYSQLEKHPRLKKIINSDGRDAFFLIVIFRLLPFMPSGLVTFAAAVGKVSFITFITASTIGKVPAMILEAVSVYQIVRFNKAGQFLLEISLLYIVYKAWQFRRKQ